MGRHYIVEDGIIVDGVAGDTPEDGILANLRFGLQLLAASAPDQLDHFLPPLHGDIAGEMARDFDLWASCIHTYWALTEQQTQALKALSEFFDAQDYDENLVFWTDEALALDERWERVRQLAQAALATFDWPLEVPPRQRYQAVDSAE